MSTPNTISNSAQSATFLVLLQVSSRGFTFIVNQILLRYLSSVLLGISQQLELFAISVLYFSRESLRVALQRQSVEHTPAADKSVKNASITSPFQRLQELINLSYLPILLGPVLATLFAWLYLAKASSESFDIPYLKLSLQLFCVAAVIELTVEPCFAFAAQEQNIRLRAAAETAATISRCVTTVASAIWASRNETDLGALPFAFGQCAYAIGLWMVYYSYVLKTKDERVSLLPKRLKSSTHVFSLFPRETLTLASSLYAQSGLKHILTQGDALLITLFANLSSQGNFALASNYGSLLARILFQPIEESSRSLFGRSLSDPSSAGTSPSKQTGPIKEKLTTVHTYLTTLLRFYSHLTLLLLVLAPPLSQPLLSLLAGKTWSSYDAPRILAKYCYYLPLLAYNGLLEAFVSATASPAELQKQSIAMLAFSAVFAAAGYVLLGILDRGIDGIIEANMCNMAVRIVWSKIWVERWWHEARLQIKAKSLDVPALRIFDASTLPHPVTLAIAVGTWALIRQSLALRIKAFSGMTGKGDFVNTVIDIVVIGLIGLPMLSSIVWYEWNTFVGPAVHRILSLLGLKRSTARPDTQKKTI